mgnify:CR=1 FL=1
MKGEGGRGVNYRRDRSRAIEVAARNCCHGLRPRNRVIIRPHRFMPRLLHGVLSPPQNNRNNNNNNYDNDNNNDNGNRITKRPI